MYLLMVEKMLVRTGTYSYILLLKKNQMVGEVHGKAVCLTVVYVIYKLRFFFDIFSVVFFHLKIQQHLLHL